MAGLYLILLPISTMRKQAVRVSDMSLRSLFTLSLDLLMIIACSQPAHLYIFHTSVGISIASWAEVIKSNCNRPVLRFRHHIEPCARADLKHVCRSLRQANLSR